jgi:hypothetical protein
VIAFAKVGAKAASTAPIISANITPQPIINKFGPRISIHQMIRRPIILTS